MTVAASRALVVSLACRAAIDRDDTIEARRLLTLMDVAFEPLTRADAQQLRRALIAVDHNEPVRLTPDGAEVN